MPEGEDTQAVQNQRMDEVWNDFRNHHPLCYQTVALKHVDGDEYIVIISEPDQKVSETDLGLIIKSYQGSYVIKKQPFGFDGWLADVVATVHLADDSALNAFTQRLFKLLYSTDYKAFYTSLDSPVDHCYYAHEKLNYTITAEEIYTWLVKEKELFVAQEGGNGALLTDLLNGSKSAGLYYSQKPGFIIWLFDTSNYGVGNGDFRRLARCFSLDTDLIIGAIGTKGKRVAIVGRERQVPVDVLPPLRTETIELLARSDNESLAQSYERHHVFGGKTFDQQDVAPIYLSDELWHTEYGNLLNITDQMLKSWSENGKIDYIKFDYPKPIDWAFTQGALRDMQTDELTYNWNTAGAGYVVPGNGDIEIFSVNRTGSLPVSYIPTGMEGKVSDDIVDAEELAYDFFSGLNSPELARVVQYATLYQIFQYYRPEEEEDLSSNTSMLTNYSELINMDIDALVASNREHFNLTQAKGAPTYAQHEKIVATLLRLAENPDSPEMTACYETSLNRYYDKMRKQNNVAAKIEEYLRNDPYGGFADFLVREEGEGFIEKMRNHEVTREEAKETFDYALRQNIDTVHAFIADYKRQYGSFPVEKAAKTVVNSRRVADKLQKRENDLYDGPVLNNLIKQEAELEKRRKELNRRIDQHNNSNSNTYDLLLKMDIAQYRIDEEFLNTRIENYKKNRAREEESLMKEFALYNLANYSKSIGALNWLLTDPGKYNEPVGAFFAQYVTTQSTWTKSPSIVSSKGESSGYGGHNLDAKITRVKVDPNLRAGHSRVTMENGKRVIFVASADRGRVTTSTLRAIERKDITGNYALPQAPLVRSRGAIVEQPSAYSATERGFRPQMQANVTPTQKRVFLGDIEKPSANDMISEAVDQVLTNGRTGKVRLERYSEQEVRVLAENMQERILQRSMDMQISLENFDVNAITVERSATDPSVMYINIPEKMNIPKLDACQQAGLELQIPSNVPQDKAVDAVKSLFDLPTEKVDNRTKWMHELKRNLEKVPELHIDDVRDDYYMIYSLILRLYDDGTLLIPTA